MGLVLGLGFGLDLGLELRLGLGLDWIGLDWIGLDLDWIVLTLIKFKQAAKSNMYFDIDFDIDCRWKNK